MSAQKFQVIASFRQHDWWTALVNRAELFRDPASQSVVTAWLAQLQPSPSLLIVEVVPDATSGVQLEVEEYLRDETGDMGLYATVSMPRLPPKPAPELLTLTFVAVVQEVLGQISGNLRMTAPEALPLTRKERAWVSRQGMPSPEVPLLPYRTLRLRRGSDSDAHNLLRDSQRITALVVQERLERLGRARAIGVALKALQLVDEIQRELPRSDVLAGCALESDAFIAMDLLIRRINGISPDAELEHVVQDEEGILTVLERVAAPVLALRR